VRIGRANVRQAVFEREREGAWARGSAGETGVQHFDTREEAWDSQSRRDRGAAQ
jgi:hypothetical protein